MQIFDKTSTKICTLTKGLSKLRSTDAKLPHPTDPDLLRIPTPLEHARAKLAPPALIQGLSATIAHEMLGQSVIYKPFVAIGALLARSILVATCRQRAAARSSFSTSLESDRFEEGGSCDRPLPFGPQISNVGN